MSLIVYLCFCLLILNFLCLSIYLEQLHIFYGFSLVHLLVDDLTLLDLGIYVRVIFFIFSRVFSSQQLEVQVTMSMIDWCCLISFVPNFYDIRHWDWWDFIWVIWLYPWVSRSNVSLLYVEKEADNFHKYMFWESASVILQNFSWRRHFHTVCWILR